MPSAAGLAEARHAVHPITDPVVRARHAGVRDTRPGTPGHALHAELESVAVEATGALLQALVPERGEAFARWRAALAMPSPAP